MKATHSDLSQGVARRRLLGLALGGGAATVVAGALPSPRQAPGVAPAVAAAAPPAGSRHSDHIPNLTLLTQSGRPIRLYDDLIREAQVVFSFMYVRCNGACPASAAVMQDLRRPLREILGPNVRLVSFTLDPEHDRPEVLARYAGQFAASEESRCEPELAPWYFLTGTADQIEQVRRALGYSDPDPVIDADRTQHAAMLTFGNDTTNRWGTLPVGLGERQTLGGVLRVLGTTPEQRYSHLPRPS
ncbi:MAG: SCO family protein [Planctomycetaceae bacterium]